MIFWWVLLPQNIHIDYGLSPPLIYIIKHTRMHKSNVFFFFVHRIYIENSTRILHSFHTNSLERKRNVEDEERFSAYKNFYSHTTWTRSFHFLLSFFLFFFYQSLLITFILTISWTCSSFQFSDMGLILLKKKRREKFPQVEIHVWFSIFIFFILILFIYFWTQISIRSFFYLTLYIITNSLTFRWLAFQLYRLWLFFRYLPKLWVLQFYNEKKYEKNWREIHFNCCEKWRQNVKINLKIFHIK